MATYIPAPHRPIEAFGRDGLPTPRLTHWPKGGGTGHLRPPTGHPGTPPLPRLFGLRTGRGLFACKGGRYDVARVPDTPFGDPYPTSYPTSPLTGGPHWPKRGTGLPLTPLPDFPTGLPFGAPYPPRLDGLRGGTGHLWPKGCGGFFRTYPHYPFGVGGRAFRPASLKHLSQTNRPVKPITEKAAIRSFLFIFGF